MQKLALTLPWTDSSLPISSVGYTPAPAFDPASATLGTAVTAFSEVALYIGAFMMFFWMVWGVFDYLKAEGNKEALAKARKRIQWAIAGFIILLAAFFLSDYVRSVLAPVAAPLTPLTK